MLAQAALERSTLSPDERTPTYVYIDEAQEYFDDSIDTILTQARKYKVGLTLAHQTLDQLTPSLKSSILANTSFKCVGGVSNKDARSLSGELRTTSDFIEGMKRRGDQSEFAVWLKQTTPHAIRLSVPLGYLERQPIMDEEGYALLLRNNRARYCGTKADIIDFAPQQFVENISKIERIEPITPAPRHTEPYAPPAPSPLVHTHLGNDPKRGQSVRNAGKGGPQHTYVQHLIKEAAQERGFRVVLEEPIGDGSIDVALYRDTVAIACEISVTSKATYEAKNLAKCISGTFTHVLAIAANAKRIAAIEKAARLVLSEADMQRVQFVTTERVPEILDALSKVVIPESTVRGYRVKVTRSEVGVDEARDRRAVLARVIAGTAHD